MKLEERDIPTFAFRFGATLAMMFTMALLALVGQELGVYGELGASLVNAGIFAIVAMSIATLWPIVSCIVHYSRRLFKEYRGTAAPEGG